MRIETPAERILREHAIERVAGSGTFQKHQASRQLFLYLAARTLAGGADNLKEYIIGVEAFSKPPTYDPQKDASVRVQLSRLRKDLEVYYQNEGAEDPVRVEIPKGQFRVTFRLVGPAAIPAREVSGPQQDAPVAIAWEDRQVRVLRRACAALALIAVILTTGMVVAWTTLGSRAGPMALAPEVKAVWASYFDDDRPVLLVLGAPLFAKYTTAETGVFFRDPRLNEWNEAAASPEVSRVAGAVGGAHITPSRIYTGVGEATGAFLLSRLFTQSKHEISLRRSHSLTLDDFKARNVIVLGAPKYNSHLKHLPVDHQFEFYKGGIRNLRPQPGEPEMFDPKFAPGYDEVEEDHALISRFPGLHGMGEITVLAGGSTEATLAAVEFVTQPRYAAILTGKLAGGKGSLPGAFEVVVRAKFRSQTPVEISYVSHRLLRSRDVEAAQAAARTTRGATPRVVF